VTRYGSDNAEAVASQAEMSPDEYQRFVALYNDWQLVRMTGWTLDYVQRLPVAVSGALLALQKGIDKAQK
jgi:hypothetical protein